MRGPQHLAIIAFHDVMVKQFRNFPAGKCKSIDVIQDAIIIISFHIK